MTRFAAAVCDDDGRELLSVHGGWASLAGELFGVASRAVFDGDGAVEQLDGGRYRMTVPGEVVVRLLAAAVDRGSRLVIPGTATERHQQHLVAALTSLDPLHDYVLQVEQR